MTFVLDRTRSFLKIEESNLLSLHRSIHPVVPRADYCREHLCDAFICVVQEYNLHRVYLALHDQQLKANLIFITDPVRPDDKKCAALLLKAREFLENIGFEMEQANINFSSATREVIIRDIRVMREPPLALQLEAAKMALEGLGVEKQELVRKAAQEQIELKTEVETLRARLIAATAAQQALPVELSANAENRGGSPAQVEPDTLHADVCLLRDEGERLRRRLGDAEKDVLKVQEELASVTTMLKSSGESLKNAKDEAKQVRKQLKHSRHENELLHNTLQSEQLAFVTVRDEVDVLRAALVGANMSLSAEKAKNESALQEMDALERNAAAELKLLKKKVDSLTAERHVLEKITADIKIKAHEEVERQQQVNQSQRRAAIKKLNALKEEIRQLAEARAVIAAPTVMPPVQSDTNGIFFPAADRDGFSVGSPQTSFASDIFGSCDALENLNFVPDKLLKGIPYSFSTDVVEIYRSYNTIHAAPTGKQAQKCDGFVCLVTEGGQSQVYVAWLMNSSGEALICLPERAADGDDSCRRMLREGIAYFERIGFLIDRLQLDDDADKRQIQLDDLAVFCRAVRACAA